MQQVFFTTNIQIVTMNKMMHFTDSINYELEQTGRLLKKLSQQLFRKLEINLSLDEYVVLDTVSINDEICQRDLAKLILKDRANTGRILDNLEIKGFIKRCIDTKNNRLVKKNSITKEGIKKLQDINDTLRTYLNGTIKKIPDSEIEKVKNILKKFRMNLEKTVEINI